MGDHPDLRRRRSPPTCCRGCASTSTPSDVFDEHRIDEQLLKALDRKVYLPSGGSLVFDRTEAMTVVDVNTGKFTGKGGNLEETVTRNNLEAAEELVRQLRLRDVGGIIVVDFIDMVLESNRELVLRRLTECLGRDRTKHQVAEVTSLGLVQMTRKRVGQGLLEAYSEPCPHLRRPRRHTIELPGLGGRQAASRSRSRGRRCRVRSTRTATRSPTAAERRRAARRTDADGRRRGAVEADRAAESEVEEAVEAIEAAEPATTRPRSADVGDDAQRRGSRGPLGGRPGRVVRQPAEQPLGAAVPIRWAVVPQRARGWRPSRARSSFSSSFSREFPVQRGR